MARKSKRRTNASGIFARVASAAASNVPPEMRLAQRWERGTSVDRDAMTTLGPVPVSTFERLKARQAEHVLHHLLSMDLDPEIAAEIAAIDPDGSYGMRVTIKGYPEGAPARVIPYAGRGRALWERLSWLATGEDAEILAVEFEPLLSFAPHYQGSYALWGPESVVTATGDRFSGLGDFNRWRKTRDKRTGGRPRKRRGNRTYAEGKRSADAQRKADARARVSGGKIKALLSRAKSMDKRGASKVQRATAQSLRAQARILKRRIKAGRK